MTTCWSLKTQGDPLGTLHHFLILIWQAARLDGMLITTDGDGQAAAVPRYVTNPAALANLNPFRPLMEINTARLIPDLLAGHPGRRVGALLRPCEMRALAAMQDHVTINIDHLLTFSVDCLGTLPADEYQWRLERLNKQPLTEDQVPAEPHDELAHEALQFARQGGVTPYRYRPACQVCRSPAAREADINLHVLGLPIRQQMLVSIADTPLTATLQPENLTDGTADQALLSQHVHIVSKMSQRHLHTLERINAGLGTLLPADVDALILQLENCGECHACLDACPICSVDRPLRSSDGHYDRAGVMRWLVSCAGCGMCEQACPEHLPTSAIFTHIRQLLQEDWV
ncbi:MAG: 4Fe-4S dicluster domain-containing protein [Acidobacteriaceae bacterium]